MQLWWTAGLTLLGWPAQEAIAASLAVHLLDLCVSLPQAALGWLALTLRRPAAVDEQPAGVDAQLRGASRAEAAADAGRRRFGLELSITTGRVSASPAAAGSGGLCRPPVPSRP